MTSSYKVYEYCKVDTECVKGKANYHKAQCDVMFNMTLDGVTKTYNKCITDLLTPTVREDKSRIIFWHLRGQTLFQASNPECKNLKAVLGKTLIDEILGYILSFIP